MATVNVDLEKETWYWPVYGEASIPFTIEDLQDGERYSKEMAWDLIKEGHPYLPQDSFIDEDKFWKYWLVSLGLLDYSSVVLYGKKGKGKSLGQAWFCYQIARLFGKRVTLDWPPPIGKVDKEGNLLCPIEMRQAHRLLDEDYCIRIRDELNKLAIYQKKYGTLPPKEELEKLIIYRAVWGFDESQTWADKARRTNLTILVAGVDAIARHLFTSMFFTFVNPNRIDQLFEPFTTHMVQCDKDRDYYNTCTYSIWDKRTGIAKRLHLKPAEWTHIWDTNYIPQVSHNIYVNLGGKDKSRKAISLADFESEVKVAKYTE
jgi:hypothetical protein